MVVPNDNPVIHYPMSGIHGIGQQIAQPGFADTAFSLMAMNPVRDPKPFRRRALLRIGEIGAMRTDMPRCLANMTAEGQEQIPVLAYHFRIGFKNGEFTPILIGAAVCQHLSFVDHVTWRNRRACPAALLH